MSAKIAVVLVSSSGGSAPTNPIRGDGKPKLTGRLALWGWESGGWRVEGALRDRVTVMEMKSK